MATAITCPTGYVLNETLVAQHGPNASEQNSCVWGSVIACPPGYTFDGGANAMYTGATPTESNSCMSASGGTSLELAETQWIGYAGIAAALLLLDSPWNILVAGAGVVLMGVGGIH
jgi:hypothetical protein